MKPTVMNRNPLLTLFLALAWATSSFIANAEETHPVDPVCPTLSASDISTPTQAHRVRLIFPALRDVDPASLGDGDLLLSGTDSVERAQFEGFTIEPIAIPLTTQSLPSIEDPLFAPQPAPVIVATYSFNGPGGSWNVDDNGIYRVRLVENAITNHEGRPFQSKFLGGFRCAIDEVAPSTIQPLDTKIIFHRSMVDGEVRYFSYIILTFDTPHVRLVRDELQRVENRFTANISAFRLPIVTPVEPITETSADRVASIDTSAPPEPLYRHRFTLTYRLGSLGSGTYHLNARVNNESEATNSFVIPDVPPADDQAPTAELAVRTIIASSNAPHQFSVTYRDRSGVDPTTLDNNDILVLSPCLAHPVIAGDSCPSNWKAQRARLVNIIPLDRRFQEVRALYEVEPPNGAWTENSNGFYPVVWRSGEVCDSVGNCNREQRLGGFEVSIDANNPPIEARAEIRVDASSPSNVRAKVHVHFARPHKITSQGIRRDGSRIYLLAEAAPNPLIDIIEPFATTQENLVYEIGPLQSGEYFAGFLMNGHLYDHESFTVAPTPPIEAEVDLQVNPDNPSKVTARIVVAFRSPHRLTKQEVVRDGHRIQLLARAEPLPTPLDPTITPPVPEPIILEYAIGELPPGGFVASFVMNDFPYASEAFVIEDPAPPIEARVRLVIDQSDPANTTGIVHLDFTSPHVITGQELLRRGNHFILAAKARPLDDLTIARVPETVTLRFPLGDLPGGDYSASFVMNGYPYAGESWSEPSEDFRARIELNVDQNAAGLWTATALIEFANPQVRISDPGEVRQEEGNLYLNATAEISDALDAPGPISLTYELGSLSPGPKCLKFGINGTRRGQVEFLVQPTPARVDLDFQTESQPSSASVTIQFRDHYRVSNQRIVRIGNFIGLLADAEGPLPILAPVPPPPVELNYELGDLEPGTYTGAFIMNGQRYAFQEFKVSRDTLAAEVSLTSEVDDTVTMTAKVNFEDPYVLITEHGTPRIEGNTIHINATAERVHFFAPPSGGPQVIDYDLGALRPGRYYVTYSINGNFEARAAFDVPESCTPLPHLAAIKPHQKEDEWFTKVVLALNPGQQVLDWGTVRQDGNSFHVSITVACLETSILPVPVDEPEAQDVPDDLEIDASGQIRMGGSAVRLVSHTYPLGSLESGHYKFVVHSRDSVIGAERFVVAGAPPRVNLAIEDLNEPREQHRFNINFHDPGGLDHTSIQDAQVWITGPDHYREEAVLESYGSTDDFPSTSGFGSYSVQGPGGTWDRPDNGGYRIFIEADKVRDLQGNAISDPLLGGFHVRILPPTDPGVNVTFNRTEEGNWLAKVEIVSQPGQQVVVDSWGPLVVHGHSFVALASVHLDEADGPVEPVAHSYDLGQLQPGYYAFVFKTNLAHCGAGRLMVPGVEAPPLTRWQNLNQSSADVADYFFASPQPRIRPEFTGHDWNDRHLGIRYRRLTGAEGVTQRVQASRDLTGWDDVSDSVDLVERTLDIDGTEVVLIRLRQSLSESPYRYLRIVVEQTE